MAVDPRTPVVIGVGQTLNRTDRGEPEVEPVVLMERALRAAQEDSGAGDVLRRAGVVAVVPVVSWRYRDPGRLVADAVGAVGAATWLPSMGGNSPQLLVNRLCREVQAGRADLGLVVGAEAYRTRMAARREGRHLGWARQGDDVAPTWSDPQTLQLGHPAEVARGILLPTQSYPLFESALWHASGRSRDDHVAALGELWAGYAAVAATNPHAWRRDAWTGPEITTPTAENRLVGSPYTKRMVANPDVDMGAGLVVASVERARALGVPEDRWVFPLAGTDGADRLMSERVDLRSSPAMRVAGRRALELAGVGVDDVAHLDVYSCFPSAVELALAELGLGTDRPLTVYGGLPFAGGPWNNPVTHAVAAMVGVLRADPGSVGLVTANGGVVEKHAFGLYSTAPPEGGFRWDHPQAAIDELGSRAVAPDVTGAVAVEGWTVMHGRDGRPERGHAACLTPDGARGWAVTDDADDLARMLVEDLSGHPATVDADGNLRLAG